MTRVQQTILVDSRSRVSGTSENFVVRLNQPMFNVVRVDLRQVIISEGIYNVLERNNEFVLRLYANPAVDSYVSYAGYIPVGYYTLKQFQQAFEEVCDSLLSEAGFSLTTDVSETRGLVVYTSDNSFKVKLTFPNAACSALFGFGDAIEEPTLTTDAYGTYYTLTAPLPMGLETIEYLAIQSEHLGNRVATCSGISAFDMIPIADRVRPLVYERTYVQPREDVYSSKKTLYQVDFRLIKPSGDVANLRGNEVAYVIEVITEY